jgi:uncharacterized protein (TIGR02246 family)
MLIHQPEDLHRAFVEAFNAGDVDALMSLYEVGAVLARQEGQPAVGAEAIRADMNGFLALTGTITLETRKVVVTGDLALLHGRWSITATAPDGSPITMSGRSAEVARRQPDGTWLYVIDNPFSDE